MDFDIKKAESQRTYSNKDKTPLALGNLFQRHEPEPKDLVDSSFSSKSLDTTRRGVPAAIEDAKFDRVAPAVADPKSTSRAVHVKAHGVREHVRHVSRHPRTGQFTRKG
jgi:hypothetical protein